MKRVYSRRGYGLAMAPRGSEAPGGYVAYEQAGRDAAHGAGSPGRGGDRRDVAASERVRITGLLSEKPVVENGSRPPGLYRHVPNRREGSVQAVIRRPDKPQTVQYAASSWSNWCRMETFHPFIQGVLCLLIGLLVSVALPLLVYVLMRLL
jgi:hypothetical protein